MADFDFLDDFDTSGDWGFSSVASKPTETQSKETQEVVKQTADGGYIMLGCTAMHNNGMTDVFLFKLDKA